MKDISVTFGITQCIKKQRHHFVDIGPSSQSYGFFNSHVWIWKLDHKEGWALKNRCFWTVVLEKILENCLDCKKIKPVNPKGNQPWIFIGRTVVEAEAPILWPSDVKSWLVGGSWCFPRPWCWERFRAGGEEGDREWDGWIASPTQWTWVWTNSGR